MLTMEASGRVRFRKSDLGVRLTLGRLRSTLPDGAVGFDMAEIFGNLCGSTSLIQDRRWTE